ncbi:MAG: protein-disulfide reductase DsbD, partial [Glaciecola sp.]
MMSHSNTVSSTRLLAIMLMVMLTLVSNISLAQTKSLSSIFDDEPQFLKVEDAFIMDFTQQDDELVVNWT